MITEVAPVACLCNAFVQRSVLKPLRYQTGGTILVYISIYIYLYYPIWGGGIVLNKCYILCPSVHRHRHITSTIKALHLEFEAVMVLPEILVNTITVITITTITLVMHLVSILYLP